MFAYMLRASQADMLRASHEFSQVGVIVNLVYKGTIESTDVKPFSESCLLQSWLPVLHHPPLQVQKRPSKVQKRPSQVQKRPSEYHALSRLAQPV